MRHKLLSLERMGDRAIPSFQEEIFGKWGREEEESFSQKRRRMAALLQEGIQKELTQRQKDCFRKYYFQKQSQEEIARELGITVPTVSRHLKKARSRLQQIARYGDF